jgi:outer membrane protein insertion porin family
MIKGGTIHYRDDRLFGSVIKLDLKGFVRNQDTERLGEIFTAGGTLALSRELPELLEGLTVIGRYELRQRRHQERIVRPAGVDETGTVVVTPRTGGLGLTLVFDRRDSQISPTRGFKIGTSFFGASRYLGGNADFLKLNVNAQYYQPLPKGMTIALNVRYDHGFPLSGAETLPKVERFYAGGDTTIRGLEEDHAWTEQVFSPVSPLADATLLLQRPRGGNIRLLGNIEFMFPIWDNSIVFGFPIKGAIFMDNGVVTNAWSAVEASDFRHSAGLALRLITPVGFTSFEYAIPLDFQPGDPRTLGIPGRFHFNFGFIF